MPSGQAAKRNRTTNPRTDLVSVVIRTFGLRRRVSAGGFSLGESERSNLELLSLAELGRIVGGVAIRVEQAHKYEDRDQYRAALFLLQRIAAEGIRRASGGTAAIEIDDTEVET